MLDIGINLCHTIDMVQTKKEEKTGFEQAKATAEKIRIRSEAEKADKEAKEKAAAESLAKTPKVEEVKNQTPQKTDEVKTPESEIAVVEKTDASVEPAEIRDGQIIFTQKHLDLIKSQIAPNATRDEFETFLMMAKRMRLDPLLKQLYFIKYDGKSVSYVTSIDSYRLIAHRTGEFAGVDLPTYEYNPQGMVTHASITVYKLIQGQRYGFSAKVKFSEYTTGKNQWASKPETMIAKVAEAHALRKAFPNDLAGVYTTDEMEQAIPATEVRQPAPSAIKQVEKPIAMVTRDQMYTLKDLLEKKGKSQAELYSWLEVTFKRKMMAKDMTFDQATRTIKALQNAPDVERFVEEPTDEDLYPERFETAPTPIEEGEQIFQ